MKESMDKTTLQMSAASEEMSTAQCKQGDDPPKKDISCSNLLTSRDKDMGRTRKVKTHKKIGIDSSYVDSIVGMHNLDLNEKLEDVGDTNFQGTSELPKIKRGNIGMGVIEVEEYLGFSKMNYEKECDMELPIQENDKQSTRQTDIHDIVSTAKKHFSVEEIMQLDVMSKQLRVIVEQESINTLDSAISSDKTDRSGISNDTQDQASDFKWLLLSSEKSTPENEPEDENFGWTVTPNRYMQYSQTKESGSVPDFQELHKASVLVQNTVDEAVILVNSWLRSVFNSKTGLDSSTENKEDKDKLCEDQEESFFSFPEDENP